MPSWIPRNAGRPDIIPPQIGKVKIGDACGIEDVGVADDSLLSGEGLRRNRVAGNQAVVVWDGGQVEGFPPGVALKQRVLRAQVLVAADGVLIVLARRIWPE